MFVGRAATTGTPAVCFHLLPSFIANEQRGNGDDSRFNQNAPSVRRRRAVQAQEDGSCAPGDRHAEKLNWCREKAPNKRIQQHRRGADWPHLETSDIPSITSIVVSIGGITQINTGHSHPHQCPISEGKINRLLIFPGIYGASVSYLLPINLWLRQSGCRETETWRERGYLSQLPTLVAVQWLRLGSAEEEERAVTGLRGSRGHRLMAEGA